MFLDNIKQYYVYCSDVSSKYAAIANIYGTITIGQVMTDKFQLRLNLKVTTELYIIFYFTPF